MVKVLMVVLLVLAWGTMAFGGEVDESLVEGYWARLEERSEGIYGGIDLSVNLSTKINETGEGEVRLDVPLYSSSERRKRSEERRNFLNEGAQLLRDFEVALGEVQLLEEKERILRTIMLEDGVRSINAYHDVRLEIVEVEARISELIRKIEVLIES